MCNKHGAEASYLCQHNCPDTSYISTPRCILASDMLVVDRFRREQGVCLEGTDAHDSNNCLCDVVDNPEAYNKQVTLWATPYGITPLAQRIIKFGPVFDFDLNFCDCFGNTILHFLAARAHPIILIRTIFDHPELLRILNTSGQSFIHCLSKSWYEGDLAFLRFLLRHLESICEPDFNNNNKTSTRTQDEGTFDIYAKDVFGRSIFHLMCEMIPDETDEDILRELSAPFEPTSYRTRDAFGPFPSEKIPRLLRVERRSSFTGRESVSVASSIGYQAQLQQTIDKAYMNKDVEIQGGKNALHCAAGVVLSPESLSQKIPNVTAERYLFDKKMQGPKSSTKSQDLDSSERFYKKREDIVKDLVELKVDAKAYDDNGDTVLMYFVAQLPEDDDRKTPVNILKSIIDSGVDIQARNRSGETALHVAVRLGKKLAMKTLVNMGANVHAMDFKGQTPLKLLATCMQGARSDIVTYAHQEACYSWLSGQAEAKSQSSVLDEWGWFGLLESRGSEKIRSTGREAVQEELQMLKFPLTEFLTNMKAKKSQVIHGLRMALEQMDFDGARGCGDSYADDEVKNKRLVKYASTMEYMNTKNTPLMTQTGYRNRPSL